MERPRFFRGRFFCGQTGLGREKQTPEFYTEFAEDTESTESEATVRLTALAQDDNAYGFVS